MATVPPEGIDALPWWRCHKVVQAAQIVSVGEVPPEGDVKIIVHIGDGAVDTVPVPVVFLQKHSPQVGGYLVRYVDGYLSFSPAEAFEAGYTRIDDPRDE